MENFKIFANLPIPVQVFDRDGASCFANSCFQNSFKDGFELFEARGLDKAAVRSAILQGESVKLPLVWRLNGDASEAFEPTAFPIRNSGGEIDSFGVSFINVTKHLDLVEELERQTYFFEKAEEIGQIGSYNSDPSGDGELICSKNSYRIFECGPDGFGGTSKGFYEKVHPDDLPKVFAGAAEAVKNGTTYSLNHRIICPDGKVKWLHAQGKLVQASGNRPARFIGVCQDITEKVLLEESMSTLKEQFQVLFDSDLIGVFRTLKDGAVTDCNSEFLRMTGYSREDLLSGKISWWAMTPEEYRPADRHYGKMLLEDGSFPPLEKEYIKKSGERFPVLVGARRLNKGGELNPELLAFALDLTEVKTLQRKVADAEKMDALGLLASGVAHDFNNILGVCGLYMEQLMASKLSPEAQQKLLLIQRHSERAQRLVDQLLAFSRNEIRAPRPTAIDSAFVDMIEMIECLLPKNISIEPSLNDEGSLVMADLAQLEQVLLNLVTNARDAMEQGGKIKIRTSRVHIEGDSMLIKQTKLKEGPHILLEVSDTGKGMGAEEAARAFQPFYTTKACGKGTGLGLSTVHGIVTQSHGHIDVLSEPGKGTTIKVYLPVFTGDQPSEVQTEVQEQAEPDQGFGGKVLLVEDQSELRSLIAEILSESGYSVVQASSGLDALKMVTEDRGELDLIISDVVMPELNGPSFTKSLDSKIPVLFISGHTYNELSRHGIDPDKCNFLPKPFTSKDLLRTVREALQKNI